MPVSEDELDHGYGAHIQQPQMHPGTIMSKAELRRSNKPIMEKRRRARINHCLNELKTIILDAMKKDPARHSKLEKADILEMTVKHLQTIQRQQLTLAVHSDPSVVQKFQTGFNECAGEVSRYIGRMEGVETGVKQRLVSHLASCVNGLQQISPFTTPVNSSSTQSSTVSEDVNNNNNASARLQMMTGLQLIPSRLPTGELALLLPNSQNLPFFPSPLENQVSTTTESPKSTITSHSVDRSRNSAFTAVKKDDKFFRSPLPSPTSTTASSYGDDSCDQPYPSPNHLPEVTSTSEHPRKTFNPSFLSYIQNNQNGESQSLLQIAPQQFTDHKNGSLNQITQPGVPNVKAIQTPLTVITSNEMLKEHPQKFVPEQPQAFKDPLDFSLKKDAFQISNSSSLFKRPYQEDPPDKFIIKTNEFQPAPKVPKLLPECQHRNIQLQERRSLFEIQNNDPKLSNGNQFLMSNQILPERRHHFEIPNQPSTSSADSSRDMWRPW